MPDRYIGSLEFNSNLNLEGVLDGVEKLKGVFAKAKPVNITTSLKGTDTGDAQQILNLIQQRAQAIDSVIVKERSLKNAAGETLTGLTQMTVKFRDENGNLLERIYKIESATSRIPKGYKVDSMTTATLALGKAEKEVNTILQQRLDRNAKISKEGQTYADKSSAWSKKTREQMVSLNETLQKQIQLYKQLAEAGDTEGMKKMAQNIDATKASMDKVANSTRGVAGVFSSLGSHLMNAIKQTISYTLSIGTMRAAQQLLNEAIKFTIDLNKEMVKIQVLQVEGAQTPEEIKALAIEYNNLAKEMGATTIQVAQGSVEWLRQGKTVQETQELMKASLMLSKLGALSSAEATEDLTSVLNSFKMSSEEAVSVVDKLIAVDNIAATSSGELATALRYVAAVAGETGVTFEQLVSYIGTISSVTRLNAEQIGQAMKTILTRMQDIREGKLDEEGMGINNVAIALQRVGINLMENETTFRDFGTVLEELAGKWNTLTDIEQANIGKAIAGTRQRNMLTILMTHMNETMVLQEAQYNSTGLAANRYGIYMQSVEASQNRLKASLEAFFLTAKKFDKIIILLNNLAAGILDLATKAGGLPKILGAVVVLLTAFSSKAIIAKVASIALSLGLGSAGTQSMLFAAKMTFGQIVLRGFTMAVRQLWAALGPVGLAIMGVGLAIAGISKYIYNTTHAMRNLREEFNKAGGDASESQKGLDALADEYESIAEKEDKSTSDLMRLIEIQQILRDEYGMNTESMDLYSTAINGNSDAITKNILKMREQARVLAEQYVAEQRAAYEKAKGYLETAAPTEAASMYNLGKAPELTPYEKRAELIEKINELEKEGGWVNETNAKAFQKQLDSLNEEIQAAEDIKNQYEGQQDLLDLLNDTLEEGADATDARGANAEKLTDTYKALTSAIQEQQKSGEISNQTAIDLINTNASLAQYLSKTADGFYLDAASAEKAAYAEMQSQFAKFGIANAAVAAANGNYVFAMSAIASANATEEEKNKLVDLLKTFAAFKVAVSMPAVSGGGGGGAGESPEKKALEAEIKAREQQIKQIEKKIKLLEKEKDALKDQLEAFKKVIAAQKEALKLKKEENEYNKKIEKKNKELSDIQTELLMLSLDNTEEAHRRKLELEEQEAELKEQIAQETEDRKYDLQVQALENLQDAFEETINAQIEAIDRLIDKFREQMDVIREGIDALREAINQLKRELASMGGGGGGGGDKSKAAPFDWFAYNNIQRAKKAAEDAAKATGNLANYVPHGRGGGLSEFSEGGMGIVPRGYPNDSYPIFLESDELFMVFNKMQQKDLLKTGKMPQRPPITPNITSNMKTEGNVSVGDINIRVAGNLDKVSLMDIKKEVFNAMNSAIKQKGKKTNAFNYSI